jgi:hypothetical protein
MDLFTLAAFSSSPPHWLPADDPLGEVYHRQDLLLREGKVVWGHLVQANQHLFRLGPDDHPALTIYAASATFDDGFRDLEVIARRLFGLKNTTPDDPDELRAAARITDERDRKMGWVVPPTLTGGKEVFATTFMVFRSHLPQRHLQSGWFPLLIHAETPAVMIVPSIYWPNELVQRWSRIGTIAMANQKAVPATQPPTLLQEFVIERALGAGAMGQVHLVRSRSTGMRFAVKRSRFIDPVGRRNFLAELQSWINLPEHP